ncbi:MAG: hypothetical protein IT379_15440 [Deltaproteobacteria bacterium]|nr:hypothetical protein [Deltaproteobacteria bacterium]
MPKKTTKKPTKAQAETKKPTALDLKITKVKTGVRAGLRGKTEATAK